MLSKLYIAKIKNFKLKHTKWVSIIPFYFIKVWLWVTTLPFVNASVTTIKWKSSNHGNSAWNRPMSRIIISSRFITKYILTLFKNWGLEIND